MEHHTYKPGDRVIIFNGMTASGWATIGALAESEECYHVHFDGDDPGDYYRCFVDVGAQSKLEAVPVACQHLALMPGDPLALSFAIGQGIEACQRLLRASPQDSEAARRLTSLQVLSARLMPLVGRY